MTLIELDSKMRFLKLSNDPQNGTQNDSEGLKIVRKFKNYNASLKPALNHPPAVNYSLHSFTRFARLLLPTLALIPPHKKTVPLDLLRALSITAWKVLHDNKKPLFLVFTLRYYYLLQIKSCFRKVKKKLESVFCF